jgi:hypothetical protein
LLLDNDEEEEAGVEDDISVEDNEEDVELLSFVIGLLKGVTVESCFIFELSLFLPAMEIFFSDPAVPFVSVLPPTIIPDEEIGSIGR